MSAPSGATGSGSTPWNALIRHRLPLRGAASLDLAGQRTLISAGAATKQWNVPWPGADVERGRLRRTGTSPSDLHAAPRQHDVRRKHVYNRIRRRRHSTSRWRSSIHSVNVAEPLGRDRPASQDDELRKRRSHRATCHLRTPVTRPGSGTATTPHDPHGRRNPQLTAGIVSCGCCTNRPGGTPLYLADRPLTRANVVRGRSCGVPLCPPVFHRRRVSGTGVAPIYSRSSPSARPIRSRAACSCPAMTFA